MNKLCYQITNWKHHNQTLINSDSLTLWMDAEGHLAMKSN
ncbi:hypothetical protein BTN50_0909 [Candidatus Enterovibrio altilux]|uniref:Mobile element protein n=1 Tax=Candidatus Enterovibrio altilux TaxID=1927128 RepID=A0A291B8S7_9GAMM|nr:hypothetical protein BTN50_0909 [Candidatus Enterovibrio luxaltus]